MTKSFYGSVAAFALCSYTTGRFLIRRNLLNCLFVLRKEKLFTEFSSKRTNMDMIPTICQTLIFGTLNKEIYLSPLWPNFNVHSSFSFLNKSIFRSRGKDDSPIFGNQSYVQQQHKTWRKGQTSWQNQGYFKTLPRSISVALRKAFNTLSLCVCTSLGKDYLMYEKELRERWDTIQGKWRTFTPIRCQEPHKQVMLIEIKWKGYQVTQVQLCTSCSKSSSSMV